MFLLLFLSRKRMIDGVVVRRVGEFHECSIYIFECPHLWTPCAKAAERIVVRRVREKRERRKEAKTRTGACTQRKGAKETTRGR